MTKGYVVPTEVGFAELWIEREHLGLVKDLKMYSDERCQRQVVDPFYYSGDYD